jgi:putative salt-induced outer membrane protein
MAARRLQERKNATMHFYLTVIGMALMLGLFGVQAAETDDLLSSDEPLQPIGFFGTVTGDVELGFLFTSGNTDSFAIRANSELIHDLEFFRNRYQLQSLLQKNNVTDSATGEERQITTANRYSFTGQSNYKLVTGRESIFARGAYSHDKFGAFREQASFVAGYGNRVYEKRASYLDLETGPGFAEQQSSSGNKNSGLIWYLAANLDYKLFDNSSFRQTLESATSLGGENSTLLSRSSITAKVADKLSMRFNFVVKYNSKPEANLRQTDTETSASLVYTF